MGKGKQGRETRQAASEVVLAHSGRLPTESDFGAESGDCDQICAYNHFGGLSLQEAYKRFTEDPNLYQEDFMFMGTTAFKFYFPVIEQYVRALPNKKCTNDSPPVWILAMAIKNQFSEQTLARLESLIPSILDLAKFVELNVSQFYHDPSLADERHDLEGWSQLVEHIRGLQRN